MAVPDFQTLMRPLLEEYAVGGERRIADVRAVLARKLGLTEDELAKRLPSGLAGTFDNRVGWAATYLYRVGLLARPRRSVYMITDRGREVLATQRPLQLRDPAALLRGQRAVLPRLEPLRRRLQGLLAPLAQQALGDVVLAAQLGDRAVAAKRRQHDLELLLRRELPVLAVVAQRVLPSVERPMLTSAPDRISASPYGLGSDPVRTPSTVNALPGSRPARCAITTENGPNWASSNPPEPLRRLLQVR